MKQLLHIYGPIAVQSYGLMIALGLLVFILLVKRNERFQALQLEDSFFDILILGIVSALIGGRTLFVLSEQGSPTIVEFFSFWEGGFSILGAIIGVLICLPPFLWIKKIPLLSLLDLVAIYTPILQAFGRVGCLFAGCCYGANTTVPWAITYTDSESAAPLCTPMHPTQLYSVILLLISFLVLYFGVQKRNLKPGAILSIYLILVSTERFIVDFWRDDRVFSTNEHLPAVLTATLSSYQLLALGIFAFATIFLIYSSFGASNDSPQRN